MTPLDCPTETGLRARCVELECLLQAKTAYISHLEAEKDTQARSHAERLTELQESCQRKVQQLQLSHQQQLAAAHTSAAENLTAVAAPAASAVVAEEIARLTQRFQEEQTISTAELNELQTKLSQSEQRKQLLHTQLDSSNHTLEALSLQIERLQQELAAATATTAAAEDTKQTLQTQCSSLQQQVGQLQHGNATGCQQQSAAMLQLLEGQLVSLSGQVKQKDQQLAALQQTVQLQCDERALMQIQIAQLSRAANADGAGANNQGSAYMHRAANTGTAGASNRDSASMSNEQQTSVMSSASVSSSVTGEIVNTGCVAPKDCGQSNSPVHTKAHQAKLNRMASAAVSEQSMGKTGLLARILATDSTTGKACR